MKLSVRTIAPVLCAVALGFTLVLTYERATRFETCLVCGTVRAESSVWSLPIRTSTEEREGFTSWARSRAPAHGSHEWVYSHTLTDGELSCSKSPFPYFLSGIYANVGPTREVEELLDELLEQLRAGSLDEAGLLARSAEIRALHQQRGGEAQIPPDYNP